MLLEPKINRRVNWELTPENHIHRQISTATWTALAHVLCEVLSGSCYIDEDNQLTQETGINIHSLNTDWDVLAKARVICEVTVPQSFQMEIDEDCRGSKKQNDENKANVRTDFRVHRFHFWFRHLGRRSKISIEVSTSCFEIR